jgi:LCP family protein required for cell wall assembly
MKKPIDPNLDNIIDDIISPDNYKNADNAEPSLNKADLKDDNEINFSFTGSADVPEKKDFNRQKSGFEIEAKSGGEYHHSHHHSSGEHRHSSSSHHSHHHKKKKKLSIPAKIGISALSIILAVVIAFAGTFAYLETRGKSELKDTGGQTEYQETIEYKGNKYVYNSDVVAIAFLGVDKRDLGLENGAVGTGGQADADILLTVNTKTGKAKAIAIPRDTMVDVDLYSESGIFLRSEKMQLCLSFAYGDGKNKSAQNVTTSISRILYDVPITKYFALDLNGIAPINDSIGGVTVDSLYDFKDLGIKQGDKIKLKGDMTEKYVRQRDMDTINASLNRTARQVQYIKAFASQVIPAVTQDFSVVNRLYDTASKYSTTNLSLSNVTYLASLMLSKGITNFDTTTIEGTMKESTKKDYADYVYAEFYPDEDKLMELVLDTFYIKQNS